MACILSFFLRSWSGLGAGVQARRLPRYPRRKRQASMTAPNLSALPQSMHGEGRNDNAPANHVSGTRQVHGVWLLLAGK